MYYKEKIIDGVLCWKNSPNSSWRQFSREELTKKLTEELEANKELMKDLHHLDNIYHSIIKKG